MLVNAPILSYQETAQLPIEIYIKEPSHFIIENASNLLPGWQSNPSSILLILLHAQMPIEIVNQKVEEEKYRLKQEFLKLGNKLKFILEKEKCLIEIIDPQEGKPMNTYEGSINFDIVTIVHRLLGLSFQNTNQDCKVLNHPTQKTAIYPSILLSNKPPKEISLILHKFFQITPDSK